MPIHIERHYAERIGWLRAAVLGANDGIVSTASLVVGVAAASAGKSEVLVAGTQLTPAERAGYEARIESVLAGAPPARRCYDVDVQRVEGGIYLAFHLQVARDLSVAAVHAVTEEVENRLRRELPELGRVVIHAEPFVVAEEE